MPKLDLVWTANHSVSQSEDGSRQRSGGGVGSGNGGASDRARGTTVPFAVAKCAEGTDGASTSGIEGQLGTGTSGSRSQGGADGIGARGIGGRSPRLSRHGSVSTQTAMRSTTMTMTAITTNPVAPIAASMLARICVRGIARCPVGSIQVAGLLAT